jgi:ABC-type multidrug transport system ATPase subunit
VACERLGEHSSARTWNRRPAAYPELTVAQTLGAVARFRELTDRHPVEDIITRLGLESYANHRAPRQTHLQPQ